MRFFSATILAVYVSGETCYPELPVCQPEASCCAGIPECDWETVVRAAPHAENSEWFDPCAAKVPPTCMITMEGHMVSSGPDTHCISPTSDSISWQWPAAHSCVDGFVLAAGGAILVDFEDAAEDLNCNEYTLSISDGEMETVTDICSVQGLDKYPLSHAKADDAAFTVDRDIPIKKGSVWRISVEPTCVLLKPTASFKVALHAVSTQAGTLTQTSDTLSTTPQSISSNSVAGGAAQTNPVLDQTHLSADSAFRNILTGVPIIVVPIIASLFGLNGL